ncbi:hypothetical protein CsSME_00021180 [Camellia sinensis var. sinensis]
MARYLSSSVKFLTPSVANGISFSINIRYKNAIPSSPVLSLSLYIISLRGTYGKQHSDRTSGAHERAEEKEDMGLDQPPLGEAVRRDVY